MTTTRMTVQRLGRLIADGDVDAVRTAVEASPRLLGRAVERAGQGGWTPLHVAVAECRPAVVAVLVRSGGDLLARTEHHRTPLHVALESCPDLVPLLVELGVTLDAPAAAFLDDVEELTRRVDDGAALTDARSGVDLLSWAALGGAAATARLLLARGADASGGALHAAAEGVHPALVGLLLETGADVDRRDPDSGRAPLHAAVAAGPGGATPEIVRLLLTAGADPDATTDDGASALDMIRVAAARSRRDDADRATDYDALAELLVTHGAKE